MSNRFRTPYAITLVAIFGLVATLSAAAVGMHPRLDKLRTSGIQRVDYVCVHWGKLLGGQCYAHLGHRGIGLPKCCFQYKYSGGGAQPPPSKPLPIPNPNQ